MGELIQIWWGSLKACIRSAFFLCTCTCTTVELVLQTTHLFSIDCSPESQNFVIYIFFVIKSSLIFYYLAPPTNHLNVSFYRSAPSSEPWAPDGPITRIPKIHLPFWLVAFEAICKRFFFLPLFMQTLSFYRCRRSCLHVRRSGTYIESDDAATILTFFKTFWGIGNICVPRLLEHRVGERGFAKGGRRRGFFESRFALLRKLSQVFISVQFFDGECINLSTPGIMTCQWSAE